MAAQPQQEAVNIATLGPQQLNVLREQLSQEVDDLADSHATLGRLALRSSSAARAVETLGESKKDQAVLLPLTQSLYVKGKVADTERVMVSIGTDYYVEMTVEKAADYCRRRTTFLQQQQQGVQKAAQERQKALNQVTNVLQQKIRALQSSQPSSSGGVS